MCLLPGNNVFGEAVRDELQKMKDSPDRASYILMKRVHPVVYRNYAVIANRPVDLREMVSELGIFGCLLAYVMLFLFVLLFLQSWTLMLLDYDLCCCFC